MVQGNESQIMIFLAGSLDIFSHMVMSGVHEYVGDSCQ